MIPELLYLGSPVYALDGRTYHHAIIEFQSYNDKQNNPVVRISLVTAPHYGHIKIPCNRVTELPTKRNRLPPSRFSSGNVAVIISHRVNLKTVQQQQPLHSRNRPPKRVVERGQAGFRGTQEGKRKRSPGSVGITENPTRRKRSNKCKSIVPRCRNVISKIQPMRLPECYSPTKSEKKVKKWNMERTPLNVP